MTKYTLTSTNFTGQVTFGYRFDGKLMFFHNEGDMSEEHFQYLLSFLPLHVSQLDKFRKSAMSTITEIPADVSWERFWETYNQKINAKRCKPLWEALTDYDKMLAIVKITHYLKYCERKNINVANPEKYLRDRYFDTDWLKLK
jgi:hypothetical protein